MPQAKTLNERDAKLVRWLGEAHAKEAELEADLTAHIALTQKQSYKKRLQQHLKETRDHKRRVASRIKQLGVPANQGLIGTTGSAVGEVTGKTVAAVKGQVGAARALVTDQAETHLRNAEEELGEEHTEIALYSRIEAFATEVGDRDTAKLVKAIRRDEERMAKYLQTELGRLVKDIVRGEIPRDQRATASRSRSRRSASTSGSRTSGSRTSGSRTSASSSRARSGASSGRSRTSSPSTSSRASGSRSGSSRSASSRTSSSRGSSRTRSRAGARS
jgi:ferritin-like metal-binding protein YciE